MFHHKGDKKKIENPNLTSFKSDTAHHRSMVRQQSDKMKQWDQEVPKLKLGISELVTKCGGQNSIGEDNKVLYDSIMKDITNYNKSTKGYSEKEKIMTALEKSVGELRDRLHPPAEYTSSKTKVKTKLIDFRELKIRQLKADIVKSQTELEQLKAEQGKQLLEKEQNAESQIEDLAQQLKETTEAHDTAQLKIGKLEENLEKAAKDLGTKQLKIGKLEENLEKAAKDLDTAQLKIKQLEEQLSKKLEKQDKDTRTLDLTKKDLEEEKERANKLEKDIQTLNERKAELEQENSEFQNKVDKLNANIGKLNLQISQKEENIVNLQETYESREKGLLDKLHKKDNEIDGLQEKLQEIKDNVEIKKAQIKAEGIEKKIKQVESEILKADDTKTLEEELQKLKKDHETALYACEQLRYMATRRGRKINRVYKMLYKVLEDFDSNETSFEIPESESANQSTSKEVGVMQKLRNLSQKLHDTINNQDSQITGLELELNNLKNELKNLEENYQTVYADNSQIYNVNAIVHNANAKLFYENAVVHDTNAKLLYDATTFYNEMERLMQENQQLMQNIDNNSEQQLVRPHDTEDMPPLQSEMTNTLDSDISKDMENLLENDQKIIKEKEKEVESWKNLFEKEKGSFENYRKETSEYKNKNEILKDNMRKIVEKEKNSEEQLKNLNRTLEEQKKEQKELDSTNYEELQKEIANLEIKASTMETDFLKHSQQLKNVNESIKLYNKVNMLFEIKNKIKDVRNADIINSSDQSNSIEEDMNTAGISVKDYKKLITTLHKSTNKNNTLGIDQSIDDFFTIEKAKSIKNVYNGMKNIKVNTETFDAVVNIVIDQMLSNVNSAQTVFDKLSPYFTYQDRRFQNFSDTEKAQIRQEPSQEKLSKEAILKVLDMEPETVTLDNCQMLMLKLAPYGQGLIKEFKRISEFTTYADLDHDTAFNLAKASYDLNKGFEHYKTLQLSFLNLRSYEALAKMRKMYESMGFNIVNENKKVLDLREKMQRINEGRNILLNSKKLLEETKSENQSRNQSRKAELDQLILKNKHETQSTSKQLQELKKQKEALLAQFLAG